MKEMRVKGLELSLVFTAVLTCQGAAWEASRNNQPSFRFFYLKDAAL